LIATTASARAASQASAYNPFFPPCGSRASDCDIGHTARCAPHQI